MSFGTFGLFNFFQQPNTGRTPNPSSLTQEDIDAIRRGTNHSGAVADFNWPFPYVLTNTPSIIIANKASPNISIYSDSYLGLRSAEITSNFSGSFYKDYEYENISSDFHGVIWPNMDGIKVIQINFSGYVTGSPFDNFQNSISFSGEFSPPVLGLTNQSFDFSGNFVSGDPGVLSFNTAQSGSIFGILVDNASSQILLSGSFYPTNQDNSNILYNLSAFSVQYNVQLFQISGQDDCNVYYDIYAFTTNTE